MANLTRYNPFNEVISLRDAMDRLFEDSFISRGVGSGVSRGVAANLYETAEGFILQVPVPSQSGFGCVNRIATREIFLCPLQASISPRFCAGLSSKTVM
jgi:hypothetical protein